MHYSSSEIQLTYILKIINMKKNVFVILGLFITWSAIAQWTPQQTEWYYPVPEKVAPGKTQAPPPSDAFILFNVNNLSKWLYFKVWQLEWIFSDESFPLNLGTEIILIKK